MNKRLTAIFAAIVGVGLIIIVGLLVAPKSPISPSIKKQLPFALFVPVSPQVKLDRESVKYSSNLKLLSFTLKAFDVTVIMSEQAAPDTFADIPGYYDKVLDGMGQYKSFDVPAGTIHLARPKDAGGKQVAIVSAGGTLIFAKPNQDFSEDQWRQFFKSLTLVK